MFQLRNFTLPPPRHMRRSMSDLLNMTTINSFQSEIFSFNIPGFKIIIILVFFQQDNDLNIMSSQFNSAANYMVVYLVYHHIQC
jgi:hypothetical protein